MKKLIFIVFLINVFYFSGKNVFCQNQSDIRINEVLVFNDSSIVDEHNKRGPWIELFNTAYNKVNIGECYISNDRNNPKKFKIIKGAANCYIESQGYLLFWADGDTSKGVNHLNFTLQDGDFLAFYDADENLIDSITLQNQQSNVSFGYVTDGIGEKGILKQATPNGTNSPEEKITSSQMFLKLDPWGIGMAIIAMSVVFTALMFLYLIFRQIGLKFKSDRAKNALIKEGKLEEASKIQDEADGNVYAAIGLALHMYTSELHDFEEAVLTINKVSRSYSPWSSKIYGLRQNPDRK
ncbi:MAG: OadG family transporter subunit [Bacteroidales bacterium]|nr:OadG family transporter subunit [Bacteroidales bacterium]